MMLLLVVALALPAFAQIKGTLGKLRKQAEDIVSGETPLSQEEVGAGLKEALNIGVGEAVSWCRRRRRMW